MIPFAKPFIDRENRAKILDDMDHLLFDDDGHKISNGEWCRKIEDEVARISGADVPGVACGQCTQAMFLGLGATGARGHCWTQSFTWISTPLSAGLAATNEEVIINQKKYLRISQVFYRDIDPERWCARDYNVPPAGQEKQFALIVDTFGMQYSPQSHVPVYYDRAHSLGVKFRTMGALSFLSFSPSKILTGGEGGMILTNNPKFVQALINARDIISRMDEKKALLIHHGLKRLPEVLEWKRECYNFYKQKFPECQFQVGDGNHQVIGMLFPSHELRDKVFDALKQEIEFKKYYEPMHHRKPDELNQLPITNDIYARILCLPSWYKVDREFIARRIREVMEDGPKGEKDNTEG